MTKEAFAEQILQTVDNDHWLNLSNDAILEDIKSLLDLLEPKNRKSFSKWGKPHEQSTPENCWI